MKALTRKRRDRFALFYALLAFGSLASGVAGGALAAEGSNPWIFPIAGLAGYVACSAKALRFWQGRGPANLDRDTTLRHRFEGRHAVAGFVLILVATSALGQQTIFSVPNADVLDKGKTYLEVDDFARFSDPSFNYLTFRGVYGLGSHIEAGVNFGGLNLDGHSAEFLTPNIKWQPLQSGDFSVTTGAFGLFYLDSDDGDEAALGYVHGAWRIPSTKTRLTLGGWVASDGYAGPDSEAGFLAALEQPLGAGGWILAADYFSGENALGYFNPGVIYTTGPWAFYGTYSIKNGDSNGNGFLLEVGFTF